MPQTQRLRVVWLTNFAAPYRRSLWAALHDRVDLTVVLIDHMGSDEGSVRGHDWFESGPKTDYRMRHLRVKRHKYFGREFILRGRRSLDLLRSADIVLLGGWEQPIYWTARIVAARANVKAVGFYESTPLTNRHVRGPISWARGIYMRSLDAIVTPGVSATDGLRGMGVPAERIHTGFNSVDVNELHRQAEMVRRATDPSFRAHRYIFVGQLIERKNVNSIISAFAQIARPQDRLSIVGDGIERSRLVALAIKLKISHRVDFIGSVPYDQLPQLFSTHHTLVLASVEEVWGLVVNEALAFGLHAVVSDRCGVAASINRMRGVYISRPTTDDVSAAMSESRDAYTGPILQPEILECGPTEFAAVFVEAFSTVVSRSRKVSK